MVTVAVAPPAVTTPVAPVAVTPDATLAVAPVAHVATLETPDARREPTPVPIPDNKPVWQATPTPEILAYRG